AILASIIAGVIVSQIFIRKSLSLKIDLKENYAQSKEILKFALPTFITILGLTSLFTSDVILVRHFFLGEESGFYSALSVLGKVIHFATIPLIYVLFPMISERQATGESYKKIL